VGVDGLTMLAMMVVGRFVGRVDVRWLLGIGFAITTISLWLSR
jgi:DHA2 family multidrug resistance protein